MMTPSRLSCSPRSSLSAIATVAIGFSTFRDPLSAIRGGRLIAQGGPLAFSVRESRPVVHLHPRAVAHRPDGFVAAHHDGVARLQPAAYFDVRHPGDARLHRVKLRLAVLDHEHSLPL